MKKVPVMISTKDIAYLKDIFSWNFTASKTCNHFKVEMEEVDENIYTSLRNLSVFDELLGRDSAKDIKQIREEHIDDREVHFSNYTTIVDETTDYNLTDFEWYYDSQYTIAGNGYRINE